jgi:predicted phage tail protein
MPDSTRIAPEYVDAGLAAATTLYAVWLWGQRKKARPETTWQKVVFGVALVLGAAGLRYRLTGGGWEAYELTVWRMFAIGGAPVILGEIAQTIARRAEARAYREAMRDDETPPGW